MSKQIRPWFKGLILGALIAGGTLSVVSQTFAYTTMSPNPSDPATCLACHTAGHGEEPAAPENEEPAVSVQRPPSAPYPKAASPDVVWSLYLAAYGDWDELWKVESSIQPPVFDDSWGIFW